MSASSAACAVSCRGSASSNSREPVITNGRTSRSDSARASARSAFWFAAPRVTEVTVGEPSQQLSLDDRDVTDNWCRAVQHITHRVEGPGRIAFREADHRAGITVSRPSWPAHQRAPRARRGPRRTCRGGPGWPASSRSPGSPARASPLAADHRYSAALNSCSASWWRPRAGLQHAAHNVHEHPDVRPGVCLQGPRGALQPPLGPRRTHPSRPSCRPASPARAR